MSTLTLPTKPVKAKTVNARILLMYSKPKAGKTTILSQLDNCLLIDLENGSDFVDGLKVDGSSLEKLRAIGAALVASKHEYDYIAIDPITRLEDIVLPLAKQMYQESPMGKSFVGASVLDLPNGLGYYYLRKAFEKTLWAFRALSPRMILSGHLREKLLEKNGKQVESQDVDLTGKLRSIVSSHADAIGLLYRKDNQGILSFERKSDSVIAGARPLHLRDKEIVLSETQEDGSVVTFWDRIFIPE